MIVLAAAALLAATPGSPIDPRDMLWDQMPTGDELAMIMQSATERPPEARVVLQCVVTESRGLKDCKVIEESPTGYGFGETALKATRYFRAGERTRSGLPTPGRAVRLPIIFKGAPEAP